jgi:1-deoxy-D-xylulose-5-phosphate reductoisomerase
LNKQTIPKQELIILGSTGSIGCSVLEVVRQYREYFDVVALVAGANSKLLQKQILEFKPRFVGSCLKFDFEVPEGSRVFFGDSCALEILDLCDVDTVVSAIVGVAGLASTWKAVALGRKILLANKESIVCAGSLLLPFAKKCNSKIIPLDSEHSSIYQLLHHSRECDVESITITASGGPFLNTPLSELQFVNASDAIKHPRWSMGKKISVDSATMVNKALELAEAHFLFALSIEKIKVLIHPQSIVHGIVTLVDGTNLLHASEPDMKAPIAYALSLPINKRLPGIIKSLDLQKHGILEFKELDSQRFPAVSFIKSCISSGQSSLATFTIANDYAVEFFLASKIRFLDIFKLIEKTVEHFEHYSVANIEDVLAMQGEISDYVKSLC